MPATDARFAFRPGLRLRVALALALACLLVVGALGFTLYAASEEMENGLIDQIMAEEMDFLLQRHRREPGPRAARKAPISRATSRATLRSRRGCRSTCASSGAGRHEM